MENGEHWVYECNIEIKSEPDDDNDEFNETDTFYEIGTEPSTSKTVHNVKSTLIYDSCKNEETEIPLEQDYDQSDKSRFESGPVALNSNIDHQKLLEGIYILETQRAQAIKDLDELYELQEQALSDPTAFIEKLQNHNVNFSASSKIHELPVTDWSKYELNFNASRIRRQQTELAAKVSDLIKSVGEERTDKDDDSLYQVVRPKQRYKLWTAEEQKKLEELLIQFPPEEVETRRYKKIADCLENRTAGQVAGRVRKYFKALKKHGISIREGMPTTDHVKNPCSCTVGPNPSTLLVSHQPPIYKPDGSGGKSNILYQRRKLIRHNFFKFWTDEEQKKLDDLLIKFPPEENESSRWEKISEYFENRTPRQVASRVNYLKRLMQNGKFVPGKIPGIQFNEISGAEIPRYSHGSNIMQYWTPKEQKRLEELLMQFPSEKHEFRRWKKIANCLGNRTPAQVAARAKSYFVMLKRYGLPVPGKVPRNVPRLKLGRKRCCTTVSDSSTYYDSDQPPSTVESSMESERDGSSEKDINQKLEMIEKVSKKKQNPNGLADIDYKSEKDINQEVKMAKKVLKEKQNPSGLADIDYKNEKDINQELEMIEKVFKEKQNPSGLADIYYKGEKDFNQELEMMEKVFKEKQNSSGIAHIGYKCSKCKIEPIMGVRWHCRVCNTQSVDFCSDCCASEYKELDEHRFDHPLEAIPEVTH